MQPIRGQIINIKAPWIYQIIIADVEEPCYVIPNTHSVILGGTKQPTFNLAVDHTDKIHIIRYKNSFELTHFLTFVSNLILNCMFA